MPPFDHENLDVYRLAIDFVVLSNDMTKRMPLGKAYVADQLQRAALSIPLNIAEGAGEFSRKEKARFYRMAKRSTMECAAILDVCSSIELAEKESVDCGRGMLLRIAAMLTRVGRRCEEAGTGTGRGTGRNRA